MKLNPVRIARPNTSDDRRGPFQRGVGYTGWTKSLYTEVWFDSTPERAVANILDEDASVSHWVRLHRNDLPILWHNAGRDYNPDLIAVENDGTHLLIEVKSDRDIDSIDVTAKAEAALRRALPAESAAATTAGRQPAAPAKPGGTARSPRPVIQKKEENGEKYVTATCLGAKAPRL